MELTLAIAGGLIILISILIVLLLFYRLYFLRNPKIIIPKGNNLISPACGKIVKITKINSKEVSIKKNIFSKIKTMTTDLTKPYYLICIMMTPFDVHFQKAPIEGIVTNVKYKKGKLHNAIANAESLKAVVENERNEIIIKTKIGKIKVIQIAGVLARRIHCFVERYQKIKKGQDLGVIKLGSQVVLIIPKLKLKIKEGDKVAAGETVIAEL